MLWVIATMSRPFSSKIPRKWGSAECMPRSEVSARPVMFQYWIDGIWGTSPTVKKVLKIGWVGGMSTIG